MGGIGSGRHRSLGGRDTTDRYCSLDVRQLKRDGVLEPHKSFSWQWTLDRKVVASIDVYTEPERVILSYRHRSGAEAWKEECYPVRLDWTDCHLGGKRPWFLCPVQGCGRRVAILYGGTIFACRHCHQLSYRSQREPEDERASNHPPAKPGAFDL